MNSYSYAQSSRISKEKEYWTKLKQLANENNILEFYRLYSEYLEWNNILSKNRTIIHKMAKGIVKLIEEKYEKVS